MEQDTMSTKIEKLSSNNFHAWKQKIFHILALKDLENFIDADPPSGAELNKWKKQDLKAQAIIGLSLSDEYLENVREVNSTKQMWKIICNIFERQTLLNKLSARRLFYTATKKENESILQFANRVQQLSNTLKSMGCFIDESELSMALLNGLPEAYDALISAMDAVSGESETLKFDYVKSRVVQEEQRIGMRINQAVLKEESSALLSKDTSKFTRPKCTHCNRLGHSEEKCWKKHPHLNPHKNNDAAKNAALVSNEDTPTEPELVCLIAKHSAHAAHIDQEPNTDWIIDSGCSSHMTFDKSRFSSYSSVSDRQYVELGNGSKVQIVGKGTIEIKIKVSNKDRLCRIENVLHVPELGYSLLSVSSLDRKGLDITFSDQKCRIKTQTSTIHATGTMRGNLYLLDTCNSSTANNTVLLSNDIETWHKRLAHIDSGAIKKMAEEESVKGIKISTSDQPSSQCRDCIQGKGHRHPFPKASTTRTSQRLELVHSDIAGPLDHPSLGGSRYFITFIDDFSRWTVVYTMKTKSQALDCFIQYHKMAEKHTGNTIAAISTKPTNTKGEKLKTLRTDNGGEYISKKFKNYLSEHGIIHQTTIPYSPQQNGVAERMNRTLLDLVRSMLNAEKMPKSFWAEALQTAVFIRNRVISQALPAKFTPHCRWYEKAPDLSGCRIFGERCFYVLPKKKVKKLDNRSREALFIGYLENSKGYKLWDLTIQKCVSSRDVVFVESNGDPSSVSGSSSDPLSRGEELNNDPNDSSAQFDIRTTRDSSETYSNTPEPEIEDSSPSDSPNFDEKLQINDTEPIKLRRSTRIKKKPAECSWWKATANIALSATEIPDTYKSAVTPRNRAFWSPGIEKEHDCLLRNKTWKLVHKKEGMNVLPCKYVFRVKNGGPKARLVALGCRQMYGIDYLETFAPVVKLTTIRTILALTAVHDLECEQMDVTTAFLNGDLNEEIYMQIPEGLRTKDNDGMVCKLEKSLYGLKQSPRQWYAKIHAYLVNELKFKASENDPCLYVRKSESSILIIALYVDDLLIVGSNKSEITTLKNDLGKIFEMKDLGPASVMLGIEISRDRKNRKLTVNQEHYTNEVLKRFQMENTRSAYTPMDKSIFNQLDDTGEPAPPSIPYRQAIGSLIYLVSCTRPDLAFAVRKLSQYLESPLNHHWVAVKRVLRYLWTTRTKGLTYDGKKGTNVIGYSDSDYAGCRVSRKSTSGYVFLLAGAAISWKSKKQSVVATSSCEAEYVAICLAAKEAIWLARLIVDLGEKKKSTGVPLRVDNNGASSLAKNPTINERTKHIDVQYHFVRQCNQKGLISIERCDTRNQVADTLTKPLQRISHEKLSQMQGLHEK